MVGVTQRSFTSGEFGPDASARSDLQKYESAVRSGLNCLVKPQGGLQNRAGFYLTGIARGEARYDSILIDFEAEAGDSYILEFSDGKMKIIRGDGFVVYPSGPNEGDVVVIDTPYASADISRLKWTQSNDVMTLFHPDFRPRELLREDHHVWTFSTVSYDNTISIPTDTTAVDHLNPNSDDNDTPVEYQHYTYKLASIVDGEESKPTAEFTSTGGFDGPPGPTGQGTDLSLGGNFVDLDWTGEGSVDEWRVYKEVNQGGFFGYIGTARKSKFRDTNIQPDGTRSTQETLMTFADAGDRPGVGEYHQQRMILARSNKKRQTFWGTRVSSYQSMSSAKPAQEDDAFEYTLANRRRQDILWIVSLGDALVLLTRSAEWTVRGRESPVISASKPPAVKVNTNYGSTNLKPQLVGEEIIFVQGDKRTIRALGYKFETDALSGQDLTLLASHIFEDRQIKSWAYASTPYRTFFIVFTDGGIATLTYMREQEIWGATTWSTDGFVEDVQTVQLANDTAGVYVIVERTRGDGSKRRCIERLNDRKFSIVNECIFMDSAVSYNGGTVLVTGITGGDGSANLFQALGGHGLSTGSPVHLTYRIGGDRHAIIGTADTISSLSFYILDASGDRIDMGADVAGASVVVYRQATVFSGLGHLEGRTIVALADGNVVGCDEDGPNGDLVVTGGSVTLETPANVVHFGLWYPSEVEPMDIDDASDAIQGKRKVLKKVTLKVKNSRGLQVGAARENLYPLKPRGDELYASPNGFYTGKVVFDVGDDWGENGVAVIRQNYPLPFHVLSITPDFAIGE